MTDEELVEALRKCADGESCANGLCGGCPADKMRIDGACDDGIMRAAANRSALDTGKRLASVVESLRAENAVLRAMQPVELSGDAAQSLALAAELSEVKEQLADARNELCQKCGHYKRAHLGYCDGCRWRKI